MNIITCTGYGGTGSSVISDLLKEYEGVKSMGDFEFSLAHEVDGISDLQHAIVDDFNRLKTTEAIYRFKKLISFERKNYIKYFGKRFDRITENYINDLSEVVWKGFYHQHPRRFPKIHRFVKYIFPNIIWHTIRKFKPDQGYEPTEWHPRSEMRLSQDPALFFKATKHFYTSLMEILTENHRYENLVLDQLVPPFATQRYSKYFSNIKIIIIDRDPRDLYILNKKFWHEGWIPSDNVHTYIKWFALIRRNINNSDDTNVLRLKFEDCIINYDKTIDQIEKFVGLNSDAHTKKYQFFNPDISKKNIKLWKKYEDYKSDIALIENYLADYCYVNE